AFYKEFFATFPKLRANGEYVCEAQEHWERFTSSEVRGEGLTHLNAFDPVAFTGYKKLTSQSLSCILNAATGKNEWAYFGTTTFVGTNQIECWYRKCPLFHTFNAFKGRCEASTANACGYALVYNPATELFANSYVLAATGSTTIPTNVTHVVVYPGCKVSVLGSKSYDSTSVKIPLVFQQTFGLWSIFSSAVEDISFSTFNAPTSVFCEKEDIPVTTPALPDGSSMPWVVSDESRYASVAITADSTFNITKLEEGMSYSLGGTGTGSLKCDFIDTASTFGLNFEFNIQTKKFIYKILGSTPEEGERDLIVESGSFHVKFVYVRVNILAIYLNGHFFYQIENAALKFTSFRIQQTNVQVDKCNFFVPKKCGKYHKFSKKTGDCEFDYKSSGYCARLTHVDGGETWKTGWVKDGTMPKGYKNKTRFIEVRDGCVAYAYNGEKQLMKLNGKNKCDHKRGKYNFPNFYDGTCSKPERGLRHIECYCEDDDERPRHDGLTPLEWTIDGDSIVFSAWLLETTPMAEFSLVTATGDAPLVIFFGNGMMLVDNKQGGCLKNQFVHIEHSSIKKNDRFECRIVYAETGYEIRINGVLVLTYPYHQASAQIIKAKVVAGLKIRQYRTDKILATPLDFSTEPLLMGESVHFNGIANSSNFNISLLGSAQEELFTLQIDLTLRKIVQSLVVRGEVKTKESICHSIFIGVEFDIVIVNKAHSIEVYINGEIIEIIGFSLPDKKFCYGHHKGQVKMCGKKRGPKKVKGEPKWDGNTGDQSREESNEDSHEN
ncbi:hypothetical protein PMAYCL1PPCAC_08247, partial [Pristionchus mayeri]